LKVRAFLSFHRSQPTTKKRESKPWRISLGRRFLEVDHYSMTPISWTATRSWRRNFLIHVSHTSLLKTHPKMMWSIVFAD
jgi:hypothetical protein